MNKYREMKQKHQKEINEFPMFFAFNNKQFVEGMNKLGLSEKDTSQICSIGAGGYIRKADKEAFGNMFKRHADEHNAAIQADKTGNGYIFDMFLYELNNHEFSYTQDYEDTLNALCLTYDELEKNPRLAKGLKRAAEKINRNAIEW